MIGAAVQRIPEDAEDVECFVEDEELMAYYGGCDKNPGHKNLTRMNDLRLDSFPKRIRDENVLDTVKLCGKLVVRIVVGCTSPNRPPTDCFYPFVGTYVRRTASGFVRSVSQTPWITSSPCNITGCPTEGKHDVYGEVDIITNKHVVYDDIEAASTTVELFYDSYNRKPVKTLHGVHLRNSSEFLDISHVICVSHDRQLIKLLRDLKSDVKKSLEKIPPHIAGSGMCVAITHPHGMPKAVSVGAIIDIEEPEMDYTDQIWSWQRSGETEKKVRSASPRAIRKRRNKGAAETGRPSSTSALRTAPVQEHLKTAQTSLPVQSSRPTSQDLKSTLKTDTCSSTPSGRDTSENHNPGGRLTCRYVSRYTTPTCRGSSGGPVFLQFGSCKDELFCLVHSRYDRERKMNVSRRKNVF